MFYLFWRSKQRSSFSSLGHPFFFGLIISTTYSLIHLIIFAYPYLWSILDNLQNFLFVSFDTTWVILLLLILAISTLTYKRVTEKLRSLFTKEGSTIHTSFQDISYIPFMKRDKGVMIIVCILLTLIFAYAYFLRPQLASGDDILPLPAPYEGMIRFYDDLNLIRLIFVNPSTNSVTFSPNILSISLSFVFVSSTTSCKRAAIIEGGSTLNSATILATETG